MEAFQVSFLCVKTPEGTHRTAFNDGDALDRERSSRMLDVIQEIRNQGFNAREFIRTFASFDMPVVAFPSFVIVAYDALARITIKQAVLEAMWASGNTPHLESTSHRVSFVSGTPMISTENMAMANHMTYEAFLDEVTTLITEKYASKP